MRIPPSPVALASLLALCLTLTSCGLIDEDCADCGPCGIAGGPPASESGLSVDLVGRTTADEPALNLLSWNGDGCSAQDRGGLVYLVDSSTYEFRDVDYVVREDHDVLGEDNTYTWSEENLTVEIDRVDRETLSFVFTEGTQVTEAECSVDEAELIECVEASAGEPAS